VADGSFNFDSVDFFIYLLVCGCHTEGIGTLHYPYKYLAVKSSSGQEKKPSSGLDVLAKTLYWYTMGYPVALLKVQLLQSVSALAWVASTPFHPCGVVVIGFRNGSVRRSNFFWDIHTDSESPRFFFFGLRLKIQRCATILSRCFTAPLLWFPWHTVSRACS
jgi:hypothetical protein